MKDLGRKSPVSPYIMGSDIHVSFLNLQQISAPNELPSNLGLIAK